MNAVEKLEAAIGKLEAAKRYAPDGPWSVETRSRQFMGGAGGYIETSLVAAHGEPLMTEAYANTAALIVTLHRTIDAQLVILRTAKYRRVHMPRGSGIPISDELALAEAILGVSDADIG